jgi:hypothetical protein
MPAGARVFEDQNRLRESVKTSMNRAWYEARATLALDAWEFVYLV